MTATDPIEEQTARRPMSYAGAADTGPCEGRQASPSNPTGAGKARTKEPLTETFVFRCSAAEKAQLRAKADAAGLSAATLFREALGLNKSLPSQAHPSGHTALVLAVGRSNADRTEALIDASRHQWTYRAGVISFAAEDVPTEDQQAEVMDHFERQAFAGLDPTQYDVLWVRHNHEDRVELHFCTLRLELSSGRSLNIAPPGYEKAFDSLRDVMNQRHGWADPMELERTQEVRDTIEAPTRAQGRDELHAWLQDQISVGLITDRASMVDALTDSGFDIPRAGKASPDRPRPRHRRALAFERRDFP